jgi:transcriptional regulator with GAF, ATPase, and Fis domain
MVARVADSPSTVLITGESGTGKELIAKALQRGSTRRDKPFIKVNCAAIPKDLVESELFGYQKGAFTGAVGDKPGRFELADGGTLFLDEVGEIPVEIQVKLLRALQESEFERVGGIKTLKVDVRLITATNRDLKSLIADGPAIHAASLPDSLRESGSPPPPPIAAVGPLGAIAAPSGASMKEIVRQAQAELEKELISRALDETGGNVTRAAKRLQISRKSLQVKMKELGLRDDDGSAAEE